jgi:surfactin synthase thioesterase subunit
MIKINKINNPKGQVANLICFHSAGGHGNMFRPMAKKLQDLNIVVYASSLPNISPSKAKEKKRNGRIYTSIDVIVQELYKSFQDLKASFYDDVPIIFLGHSLGAIIAFELSQKVKIDQLIASSIRSPITLSNSNSNPITNFKHKLSDSEFGEWVSSIGGGGSDKAILEVTIPIIKDDYKAFETYCYDGNSFVNCPLFLLGGKQDILVSEKYLLEWHELAKTGDGQPVEMKLFNGTHFYLTEEGSKDEFVGLMVDICLDVVDRFNNDTKDEIFITNDFKVLYSNFKSTVADEKEVSIENQEIKRDRIRSIYPIKLPQHVDFQDSKVSNQNQDQDNEFKK